MTVSLAEATAAARRMQGEYPVRAIQHVPQAFIDDAVELAGFVLAGDTERLREAVEQASEREGLCVICGRQRRENASPHFDECALAEGSP